MTKYSDFTYKELQAMAKKIGIPANAKREYLTQLMDAKLNKKTRKFEELLSIIKSRRKKRNSEHEILNSGHEIVNSAYETTPRRSSRRLRHKIMDPIFTVSQNVSSDENIQHSDSVEERSVMQDSCVASPSQLIPISQSINVSASSNPPDLFEGHMQSNKSSVVVPYSRGSFMETVQSCSASESSFQSNFLNSLYDHLPQYTSTSTSMNEYLTQLPCPDFNETLALQNFSTCQEESVSAAQLSKNMFSFPTNEETPVEVDCGADLLPNIPQLEKNAEKGENVSTAWYSGSLVSVDSGRIEHSLNDGALDCTVQRNFAVENRDYAASVNVEVESSSDAETVSLPNDIVNLLDVTYSATSNIANYCSEPLYTTSTCSVPTDYQNSSMQYANEFPGINFDHNAYTAPCTSARENVLNDGHPQNPESFATSNGNICPQLPSFSSFFTNPVHESIIDHPYASYQPVPVTSASLQVYPNLNSSCPVNHSQWDRDYVDTTLSIDSNQPSFERNWHIPDYQSMQLCQSHCGETEQFFCGPSNYVNTPTLSGQYNSHPYSSFENEYRLPFSFTENDRNPEIDLARLEYGKVMSEADLLRRKHETARLIYEKKTVHHSKILYDNPADKNIEENIVREMVQIYIPSKSARKPVTRSTKLSSKSNSESEKLKIPLLYRLAGGMNLASVSKHRRHGSNSGMPRTHSRSALNITDETITKMKVYKQNFMICKSFGRPFIRDNTQMPCFDPCSYKQGGCTPISNVMAVREHEERYRFQPIPCPSELCTWHESVEFLSRHIFNHHETEIRNEGVYVLDKKNIVNNNDFFHTFYHLHKSIMYVIKLHTYENLCVASVQYIPEDRLPMTKNKNVKGTMQLVCFPSGKMKVKQWKGSILPYLGYDNEQQRYDNGQINGNVEMQLRKSISSVQIDITNSQFVILHISMDMKN